MLILIVFAVALWLYYLWTRRNLYALSWQLNGPPALPIIGNALSVWNPETNVQYLDEMCEKYESPIRVWMGQDLYIYLSDAKSAEALLRSKVALDKPKVYQTVRDGLGGDGLFTSNGELWRTHRKLLKPSLKDSTISSHLTIFNYFMREFCDVQLANEANNSKPFDILTPLNQCLLSMYLEATFGQEWTDKSKYTKAFQEGIVEVAKRLFRPWLEYEWIRVLTGYEKIIEDFRQISKDVVTGIIHRSIEAGSCSDSFVDKLVGISQENPDFTIHDIQVEAHTLLIGASDTTGVTLATAALLIAIHEEYQQRLFDELVAVMPNKDMDLTTDILANLPLMDACLRESMRLFPTVPLIGRSCAQPFVLNDVEIPTGATVIVGIRQIQRRKEYWGEDAHLFRPDRFLADNAPNKDNPGCYVPFSMGPRNCIGYVYAMYTMKLSLAHIIRNYRLTSPLKLADLKIKFSISFRMLNKMMIQMHRRDE